MIHILLVEDDKITLDMYRKMLENHGYRVSIAIDGEEGLIMSLRDHPDLILLDILMPKMDGITMLNKLREDPWGKQAKVIILTNLDANDKIIKSVTEDQPTFYLLKANTRPEGILQYVEETLGIKSEEIKY